MGNLLEALVKHREGLYVLMVVCGVSVFLLICLAWTFKLGRFDRSGLGPTPTTQNLRYLITEALTKIINDFRHLLALVLVLIFALSLAYVMMTAPSPEEVREGLQTVAATLGGLVGSIIGYYFGESKGQSDRSLDLASKVGTPETLVQGDAAGAVRAIEAVQRPGAD